MSGKGRNAQVGKTPDVAENGSYVAYDLLRPLSCSMSAVSMYRRASLRPFGTRVY